jgi:hypothetical protein
MNTLRSAKPVTRTHPFIRKILVAVDLTARSFENGRICRQDREILRSVRCVRVRASNGKHVQLRNRRWLRFNRLQTVESEALTHESDRNRFEGVSLLHPELSRRRGCGEET